MNGDIEESKLQKACGREWTSELEKKEGSSNGEQGNCSFAGRQRAQRKGKMNGWMGEDTDGGSDGA